MTRAKPKKTRRQTGAVDRAQGRLASVLRVVDQMVRGRVRNVEKRATALEIATRRRLARALREAAKQLRRAERAVAPPARPKAKIRPAKKKVGAKDRAARGKAVVAELAA
ncbi:MAG: hypothetical protein E4H03_05840 [Myxococcales bacterium]|nr:MAG: hypothetical protein E4H03_05840 [Myxococcales bacterium]